MNCAAFAMYLFQNIYFKHMKVQKYDVCNSVGSSIICICDGCKWGLSAVGCDGLAYVPGCFWAQSIFSCQNPESNSKDSFSYTVHWISSSALTNEPLSNHKPAASLLTTHSPIRTTDGLLMLTQNYNKMCLHKIFTESGFWPLLLTRPGTHVLFCWFIYTLGVQME